MTFIRTWSVAPMVITAFALGGLVDARQVSTPATKPIAIRVSSAYEAGNGTLTFTDTEIVLAGVRSDGPINMRFRYDAIEYCSFIDNRQGDGIMAGGAVPRVRKDQAGRFTSDELRKGKSLQLWFSIQRKNEQSTWSWYSFDEDQFFQAAKTFGKKCGK